MRTELVERRGRVRLGRTLATAGDREREQEWFDHGVRARLSHSSAKRDQTCASIFHDTVDTSRVSPAGAGRDQKADESALHPRPRTSDRRHPHSCTNPVSYTHLTLPT